MTFRRVLPRLFILAIGTLVALLMANRAGLVDLPERYDPMALPDLTEAPYWLTSTRLKLVDFDAENCRVALNRAGLPLIVQAAKGTGTDCARESTVVLSKLSRASLRPEETRCNIAARLYMWERHSVQPAAQSIFGEPVAEILHFGSFSCRTIAGSQQMSEHATANAFDIAGFRLRSGRTISVLNGWASQGPDGRFLHAVHDGACDDFNLVLSPDYNAAHRDHFHVDMGWIRGCR